MGAHMAYCQGLPSILRRKCDKPYCFFNVPGATIEWLCLPTIAGGYRIGDRVVSQITFQASQATISPGDIGTVKGPCSNNSLPDAQIRVLCEFANGGAVNISFSDIYKEGTVIAGGYKAGDRVVSNGAFSAAKGKLSPGDGGTVRGPCNDVKLPDAQIRVLCSFPKSGDINMLLAHFHKEGSEIAGNFNLGDHVIVNEDVGDKVLKGDIGIVRGPGNNPSTHVLCNFPRRKDANDDVPVKQLRDGGGGRTEIMKLKDENAKLAKTIHDLEEKIKAQEATKAQSSAETPHQEEHSGATTVEPDATRVDSGNIRAGLGVTKAEHGAARENSGRLATTTQCWDLWTPRGDPDNTAPNLQDPESESMELASRHMLLDSSYAGYRVVDIPDGVQGTEWCVLVAIDLPGYSKEQMQEDLESEGSEPCVLHVVDAPGNGCGVEITVRPGDISYRKELVGYREEIGFADKCAPDASVIKIDRPVYRSDLKSDYQDGSVVLTFPLAQLERECMTDTSQLELSKTADEDYNELKKTLELSKKADEEKNKLIKQLQSQLDAYDRERAR